MTKKELEKILQKKFNFDHFRDGQFDVINSLLNKKNTLAILPTGAGKTLIYQFYGELLKAPVLVVSPLLSLIGDQVARIRLSGESRVADLSSRQTYQVQQDTLNHLSNYRFVFISPEQAAKPEVQEKLRSVRWELLVIDEAHCIPKWGPSFRPDYLRLGDLRKILNEPLTLMLTATASEETRSLIIQYLNLSFANVNIIIRSVNRPNIYMNFDSLSMDENKNDELLRLLHELPKGGIIYFSSRKMANQVSELISEKTNFSSSAYHAGMDTYQRFKIQNQFINDNIDVICATSAFGMGIDKDNIHFVIHYHMPGNIESFVQEIGRAGRDGEQAISILLYQTGDENIPQNLSSFSIPGQEVIESYFEGESSNELLRYYSEQGLKKEDILRVFERQQNQQRQEIREMLEFIHTSGCHREYLLHAFDESGYRHDQIKLCCSDEVNVNAVHFIEGHEKKRASSVLSWEQSLLKLFNSR